MGKISLPLPEGYFQCPPLKQKEQRYLITKARESAKTLVEASRSNGGRVRWTPAGRYKGVQMYRGEDKFADTGSINTNTQEIMEYCCGVTTVAGTLEEVAAFFDLSTTQKMKEFSVRYNDDVLDGAVLYALVPPTVKNPMHQVTVKWTAIEMPSSLFKNRDFCTLECQDVFTDTTGRRGWVRSYHSVKLPACPSQQDKLGLIRGSLYHTGFVFVESDRPGFLDAIHCVQVNLKGNLQKNLPQRLHFGAMKRRIAAVAMINAHLQHKRFSAQRFLGDLELVPKNQRSHCALCIVKFHFLVRKTRCRKCGEVVCLSCSSQWTVNQPNMAGGQKKMRVCMKCIEKHNRERGQYLEEMASSSISSRTTGSQRLSMTNKSFDEMLMEPEQEPFEPVEENNQSKTKRHLQEQQQQIYHTSAREKKSSNSKKTVSTSSSVRSQSTRGASIVAATSGHHQTVPVASRFAENLREQQQHFREEEEEEEERKRRQVQEQHLYQYELLLRQKKQMELEQQQQQQAKSMRYHRGSLAHPGEIDDEVDKEEEEEKEDRKYLLRLRQQERQEQLQASQEFYYARNRPSVMGSMHPREKRLSEDPETSSSSSDFPHEDSEHHQYSSGLTSKLLEEHNQIHRPYSKPQPSIASIRQAQPLRAQTQAQQQAYSTSQHHRVGSIPAYGHGGYDYNDRAEYGAGSIIRRRLEEQHAAIIRKRELMMARQRAQYGAAAGGLHHPSPHQTQSMHHQQHPMDSRSRSGSSRPRRRYEYLTPPSYAEAMATAELADITRSRAHMAPPSQASVPGISRRTPSGGRVGKSRSSGERFSQLGGHAEDLGPDELRLLMEKYQMGGYMENESDESSECIDDHIAAPRDLVEIDDEDEDDDDEEEDLLEAGKLSVTNSVVNTFASLMESQDHIAFEDHFRISLGSAMDVEEENEGVQLDMTNPLVALNEAKLLENIEEEEKLPKITEQQSAAVQTTEKKVAGPTLAETKAEVDTNLVMVRLYQKILELTKIQHALQKEEEKNAVDEELQQLYQQLNEIFVLE